MPPWTSQRVQLQQQQQQKHQDQSLGNGTASSRYAMGAQSLVANEPRGPAPFRQAGPSLRVPSSSQRLPIDLISSPSRGLDSSDSSRDLTNADTQGRYRQHISERIQAHRSKHGPPTPEYSGTLFPFILPRSETAPKQGWTADGLTGAALASLQDILLLVRRLREGCVAAARRDAFALDVYTLSTFLSILIGDDIQLSSSLPRQVDLLSEADGQVPSAASGDLQMLLGQDGQTSVWDAVHTVSLFLLWLSISGGQVSRIGGHKSTAKMPSGIWLKERDRVMALLDEKQQRSPILQMIGSVHTAIAQDNVILLHRILTTAKFDIWQQAFLRRAVDRLRATAWSALVKAYMHAPIDGQLLDASEGGKSDDWLERILFVDLVLMPAQDAGQRCSPPAPVPDAWDDSVENVTTSLASTTITGQDRGLGEVRSQRLATCFEAFQLPKSTLDGPPNEGPLSGWMGRKVLLSGIPNIKLR